MSRSTAPATGFIVAWTSLLIGLAILWTRTPFLGTGVPYMIWSIPAVVVTVITWRWIRRRSIAEIPQSAWLLSAMMLLWLITIGLALSGIGADLALDGLILRRRTLRYTGHTLEWMPMAFGGILTVAGIAASLEARYRIVNDPETSSTPQDPVR
jgi:hypothetical protein